MTANSPVTVERRPLKARILPKVFRALNVPIRNVLALPVPTPMGKRLMLLHLTGRKTGKHYRQPVSYVRLGPALLITPGGGKWKLNLVPGRAVRIRLRGKDVLAVPELVRDPAEVEQLLETMCASNPMIKRFVPIPRDAAGHLDPDRLALALKHGFAVVRWQLDDVA
ncbi:MAG: nitroreductase/quinone reductase family protein [Acidimicrobiales bacterium]